MGIILSLSLWEVLMQQQKTKTNEKLLVKELTEFDLSFENFPLWGKKGGLKGKGRNWREREGEGKQRILSICRKGRNTDCKAFAVI